MTQKVIKQADSQIARYRSQVISSLLRSNHDFSERTLYAAMNLSSLMRYRSTAVKRTHTKTCPKRYETNKIDISRIFTITILQRPLLLSRKAIKLSLTKTFCGVLKRTVLYQKFTDSGVFLRTFSADFKRNNLTCPFLQTLKTFLGRSGHFGGRESHKTYV